MALKPPELMQIEVPVAYFYMCVVYLNYVYYVKTAGCIYLYMVLWYSLGCHLFVKLVFSE